MRRNLAAAVLVMVGLSGAVQAQPHSDYLGFNDDAKEWARLVTSIKSCKRLGFAVDDRAQVPNEIEDIMLRKAIVAGVDRATAEGIMLSSLKSEQRDMELFASVPAYVDSQDELIAHFRSQMDFWNNRCLSLASGGLSSHYVQRTERQEAVLEERIATGIREIEAAVGRK